MFRVNVDNNILRQCTNVYKSENRYPNPLYDTKFELEDFGSDEFRMYRYKIKKCPLNRAHDWTICPYAHKGERARRRDPRMVPYIAVSCRDYQVTRGTCPRGETCEYAHGVFEYWLHPAKYRTRICKASTQCTRSVCFFAHVIDELRIVPTTRVPNWSHLSAQREFEATGRTLSTTTNTSATANSRNIGRCGQGLDLVRHCRMSNQPNPLSLLELEARVTTLSTTTNVATTANSGNIGSRRQGLDMIKHCQMSNLSNSLLSQPSSSGMSTTTREKPQELRLEFLESLKMLRISDQYGKVNTNNEDYLDEPNIDWVKDLLKC